MFVLAQRKSPSLAEPPKPFSNFPVFHERLLDRLKSVNQLHMSFERRTKELESKFFDQLQCVAIRICRDPHLSTLMSR